MFKVKVFSGLVLIGTKCFCSEFDAQEYADNMQDQGFKVRFIEP